MKNTKYIYNFPGVGMTERRVVYMGAEGKPDAAPVVPTDGAKKAPDRPLSKEEQQIAKEMGERAGRAVAEAGAKLWDNLKGAAKATLTPDATASTSPDRTVRNPQPSAAGEKPDKVDDGSPAAVSARARENAVNKTNAINQGWAAYERAASPTEKATYTYDVTDAQGNWWKVTIDTKRKAANAEKVNPIKIAPVNIDQNTK